MLIYLAKLVLTAVLALVPLLSPPAVLTARSVSSPAAATAFAGFAPIGALMWQQADGRPGRRLCSAAAVRSPGMDLIVTAAHCVRGVHVGTGPMTVDYVPGYHDGAMPYGYWTPTKIISAPGWAARHAPDDDVAFLVVAKPGSAARLEAVTGAERVGVGGPPTPRATAVLVGYPYHSADPVACRNVVKRRSATQLEFDCAGFPGGSSGGPLLTDVSSAVGIGTLVGVVGGYERGGYRSSVSYFVAFRPAIAALYATACEQS